MNKYHHTIVLGAGMAGLGASIALKKAGIDHLVLEKEPSPGGLCSSLDLNGYKFDLGPKILILDDSENSQEILGYLGKNYQKFSVDESVYLKGYGFMSFPLQRNLIDLPEKVRYSIVKDIATTTPRKVRSYQDWLANAYGDKFCKLVLYPYEEKKWQMSLEKMDYQWALARPVKVDLNEVILGAFKKLPPAKVYFYPKQGSIETLTKAMVGKAGEIKTSQSIITIDIDKKRIFVQDQKTFELTSYGYQNLISTIPLDTFNRLAKLKEEKLLKRLAIVIVNLVYSGDAKIKQSAMYFPEKNISFRRLSALQNLCPALDRPKVTLLQAEISIDPNQKVKKDQGYISRVIKDIKELGILPKEAEVLEKSLIQVPFAYPLQLNGLKKRVEAIHSLSLEKQIYHCGRGGNYDYCNSDIAYKQGKMLGQQIGGRS